MSEALFNKLDELTAEIERIDALLADPEVVVDADRTIELSTRRAAILPVVERYRAYLAARQEADQLEQMRCEESDAELRQMAESELPDVRGKAESILERIKGELVTSDDRAVGAVILELRAGVGGDEAAIWAGDLMQMYERYAANQSWTWEPMDAGGGEMGGVKHAVISVRGPAVWQRLGYEGGTHCVKRVPSTEAQGRVHTSTATVAVLAEPRKLDVQINPDDVEIHVTTAQGPGGQNVNKVATAVKMRHNPTGIEVRMQDTKSQHQNREKAWQLLRARVYEHFQAAAEAQRAESRSKMIGRATRGERIRTYRYKENIAVDHRLGESFNLQPLLAGELDPLVDALIEQDKAQRLAAL
jgi:peptide chain release factor 1